MRRQLESLGISSGSRDVQVFFGSLTGELRGVSIQVALPITDTGKCEARMVQVDQDAWGCVTPYIEPGQLIQRLEQEVNQAIDDFEFLSVERDDGEEFNQLAVDVIATIIFKNPQLLSDDVDDVLCEKSLRGPHTKVWFPKEITSPDYAEHLMQLPESICVRRWLQHWRSIPRPRKGLIAPNPIATAILLNGTFVDPEHWAVWAWPWWLFTSR